jgi:hypothetical protein
VAPVHQAIERSSMQGPCRRAPGGPSHAWAIRTNSPNGDLTVNLGVRSILLIVAIVCFLLAAFQVDFGQLNLQPLGLAFFAAAFLVGDGDGLNLRRDLRR